MTLADEAELERELDRLYGLPLEEFTRAFHDALRAGELTTLVAKVEAVGPSGYVTDLALLENRFEFQRYLKEPHPSTKATAVSTTTG